MMLSILDLSLDRLVFERVFVGAMIFTFHANNLLFLPVRARQRL